MVTDTTIKKSLSDETSVKAGYKQTDIGVIPEDWDVKEISKLGEIRGRIGWKGYTVKDLRKSGPYTIGAKHINNLNQLDLSDPTHLSIEKYLESPEIMVNKGDLLIVQRGTIGKLVLIDKENGDATINPSMAILRFRKATESYVYYYLCSENGQNQILQDTSSTGVPMVTQKQISNFKIPIPQIPEEQTAIATILSDTDVLIERLEKLIGKKKAIKQGAMQQLLTGKKRLPGFSGEWETKLFGSLIEGNKGQQLNKSELTTTGEYPDWNGGIEPSGYTTKWNMVGNTITISEGGNSCGFVNYCKQIFWCGGHCYALKITSANLVKFFLYQLLKFKEKSIMSLRIGSGLPNIQKKNLNEFELFIPKESKEQTAIATILSDMDSEIERLEQKRDKYTILKQGMMQQLLTGRIRIA